MAGEPTLVYVDLHLVHEVTSPQAFEGLRLAGRRVRRPDLTVATMDHNVPTLPGPITDPMAKAQLDALRANCAEFGIELHGTGSGREGIVHVIGPELGLTQPGKTIVCGDSHTSTHGAFGALAFGIGTSEVEHVLATQTLVQRRPKTMLLEFVGTLPPGLTAKDVILGAIGQVGVGGGVGYVVEYAGEAVEALSMEQRLTICNMSIEWGARAGLVAPDETTFAYLEGRPMRPLRRGLGAGRRGLAHAPIRPGRHVRQPRRRGREQAGAAGDVGHEPRHGRAGHGLGPRPASFADPDDRAAGTRALEYMGLRPGQPIEEIRIDRVFIGSCTNARIEDLRRRLTIVRGRTVDPRVKAMVVPGSAQVRLQAQDEGLDQIFLDAGFEWRLAGCSMCLGMNPDILAPGERCASTSNRNFEGRQGRGGRTHLVSPQMAAAAALHGHFVDVRSLQEEAVPA